MRRIRTLGSRLVQLPTAAAIAAAVTLGLVSIYGPVAVSAASSTGQSTQVADHGRTMRFGVRFSPFNVIDVPPLAKHRGDYRPGDYAVFSDVLVNPAGTAVGTEGGSGLITAASATGFQVEFDLSIKLPQGQIAVQGLSSTAPNKRLAIVGGTGQFVGAAGHIDLVEHGDGTGTLTITLGS
jgi:Dirigent-like protein